MTAGRSDSVRHRSRATVIISVVLRIAIKSGVVAVSVMIGGVLLAGCGAAAPRVVPPPESTAPPSARDRLRQGVTGTPLDVQLEALLTHTTPAIDERRNPFRFGAAAMGGRNAPGAESPAAAPDQNGRKENDAPPTSGAPAAAASVDALRFIGFVAARGRPDRVAVLADGDGTYHGVVNEVLMGRYRILAVGGTSVEIEDMALGTRRTLRLVGS